MNHSYAKRRHAEKSAAEEKTAELQPSPAALRAGAAQPSARPRMTVRPNERLLDRFRRK